MNLRKKEDKAMNKYINEILKELFPDEDVQVYAPRYDVLYSLVFENASKNEYALLKREIVKCESDFAENTRLEFKSYHNLTPELVMQMYIGVAFSYAKMRFEQNKPILCATYLREIFSEFIKLEYVTTNMKEAYKRQISEALMDFSYASGKTDNMSFRLHNLLY